MQEPKKSHACPYNDCDAKFSRPYRVADHLYAVHTNLRAYVCQEEGCSKSYSNKSHLIRHINTTHRQIRNDVLFSCPVCLKTFANRQNLKRHLNVQHISRIYFTCDVCHFGFKKKNQLKAHMYQHTGIKSFICELCPDKAFVTLYEKKRHLRCHKKYDCFECQLTFDMWSLYQKHRKLVHDVAEFICNECQRSFKQRSHIVRHIKTHDQSYMNATYQCPYEFCQRFYTRNSNLKQHILTKHAILRHVCDICKAQLSSKTCLNKHMKIHSEPPKSKKIRKTKATGRKERKDKGIPKTNPLKLAECTVLLEVDEEKHLNF